MVVGRVDRVPRTIRSITNSTKVVAALLLITAAAFFWRSGFAQAPVTRFAGPTASQPLALSADGTLLAVANPDNNSVTFFDVGADRNQRLGEVRVQTEPNGVAVSPDGKRAY